MAPSKKSVDLFMPHSPFKLCLVCDALSVKATLQHSITPPHQLLVYPLDGILDEQQALSKQGKALLKAAKGVDAVMVRWDMEQAGLINTLCYHIRQKHQVPVFALCSGGQEEMIAALSTGADDVVHLPLFLPVLQAKAASYARLAQAVRVSAARKVKKKLGRRNKAVIDTEQRVEEAVEALEQRIEKIAIPEKAHEVELVVEQAMGELMEDIVEDLVEDFTQELDHVLLPHSGDGQALALEVGPLRLDVQGYRFYINDEEVSLTPKEFDLLRYLMEHVDSPCSRDQILDHVWGIDFDTGTNMVDVYMHFVRKKLEAFGQKGMIKTIRGRGYRLSPRASIEAA